jgi:hypothetical protein
MISGRIRPVGALSAAVWSWTDDRHILLKGHRTIVAGMSMETCSPKVDSVRALRKIEFVSIDSTVPIVIEFDPSGWSMGG